MWCFRFDQDQRDTIASLIQKARNWAKQNQCAIGVAEIALGVGLLKYGITQDLISLGTHVVGTAFDSSMKVGLASSGLAAMAGTLLGNIGIAALGGAIGIPSVMLAGGAAIVFGCAGYGAATMISKFSPLMSKATSLTMGLPGASLVAVAVALIVDGSRRIIGSNVFQTIKSAVSSFFNGVLKLVKLACTIVMKSAEDFFSTVKNKEDRESSAATSSGFATTTFIASLILTHAAGYPLLILLTILSPLIAEVFKHLYFKMGASDVDQFLYDFGA